MQKSHSFAASHYINAKIHNEFHLLDCQVGLFPSSGFSRSTRQMRGFETRESEINAMELELTLKAVSALPWRVF